MAKSTEKRTYTPELRVRVWDTFNNTNKNVAEVARDFGVPYGTAWTWCTLPKAAVEKLAPNAECIKMNGARLSPAARTISPAIVSQEEIDSLVSGANLGRVKRDEVDRLMRICYETLDMEMFLVIMRKFNSPDV